MIETDSNLVYVFDKFKCKHKNQFKHKLDQQVYSDRHILNKFNRKQ